MIDVFVFQTALDVCTDPVLGIVANTKDAVAEDVIWFLKTAFVQIMEEDLVHKAAETYLIPA